MKVNFGRKVLGSLLAMALLAIAVGCVGMVMTTRVSRVADPLMQEKIPLKAVSMEALLVAEKSLNACRNFLLIREDIEEAEEYVRGAISGFGMCAAMLAMGTESEAFRQSPEGKLYSRVGLSMKVPAPEGEVREIAEQLQALGANLKLQAEKLMTVHRQRRSNI